MNTSPEYVPYLLAAQVRAARMVGVEPYLIGREAWIMNLALLDLLAMILKAFNDHGWVLDAEWQTRLNAAFQGPWDPKALNQVDPDRPVDPGAG